MEFQTRNTKITWVRHALSCANLRRYAHSKGCNPSTHDGAVTPGNYVLASQTIPLPRLKRVKHIVCSPMIRAVETALELARKHSIARVHVRPHMAEIGQKKIEPMSPQTLRAIISALKGSSDAAKLHFDEIDNARLPQHYYESNPHKCIQSLNKIYRGRSVCAVTHVGNMFNVMNHANRCGINVKPIHDTLRTKTVPWTNLFAIMTSVRNDNNVDNVFLLARGVMPTSSQCSILHSVLSRCEKTAAIAAQYL